MVGESIYLSDISFLLVILFLLQWEVIGVGVREKLESIIAAGELALTAVGDPFEGDWGDADEAFIESRNIRLQVGWARNMLRALDDPHLVCHGCGHSVGNANFPGAPSGELACGFCVRNPGVRVSEDGVEEGYLYPPRWADGSIPKRWPTDNYIPLDGMYGADIR